MVTTARIARPTDLVYPLQTTQEIDPIADAERAAAEVDWGFDDPELTMQLRAVHRGRGLLVAGLLSSVLAIVVGVMLVL